MELQNKTILITGGTGSFGQVFIKKILQRYKIKKIIIYSRDELKQHEMSEDKIIKNHKNNVRFFIGDVRDLDRLTMAFRDVDYVIHAAALKQITVAEYNPFECIRTNVHGAENVVRASIAAGVKKVVALSTDKAANPINLYGASKLASDKIFIAAKALVGTQYPAFSVVRYGNVLASRGSVVPLFRKLIKEGAEELPVTDKRMTRFWITAQQGADFVLSCLSCMQGAEIFIPKIPSMTVVNLAHVIAPNLPIKEVGIRPGEKLHEVMLTYNEGPNTLELPDRYIVQSKDINSAYTYHPNQKLIPEEFIYSSDKNEEWLGKDDMKKLLIEAESN